MKNKLTIFFFAFLFFSLTNVHAQGFEPPSDGKAVVYFTRATILVPAFSIRFFDNDKFFHVFKKKNYIRYECDPGNHVFWTTSKSTFTSGRFYLTADLEAGKTYIVQIPIYPGVGYTGIQPVSEDDEEYRDKAVNFIKSKKPVEISDDEIKELNETYKDQINQGVKDYNEKYKGVYNIPHMSSDMYLPDEYLK